MEYKEKNRLRDQVYKAPSPVHGNGCFAHKDFTAGEHIGTYEGPEAKRNGTYVLWVYEEGQEPVGRSGRNLLRYLNHRKDGNAEFDGFASRGAFEFLAEECGAGRQFH